MNAPGSDNNLLASASRLPRYDYRDLAGVRTAMRRAIRLAEVAGFWQRNDKSVVWADEVIPGTQIGVRLYHSVEISPQARSPVILYLHGGGFMVGDLDYEHPRCLEMCRETAATVVAVDYRLAPEHRYPAALDDCDTAIEWLMTIGPSRRLDPTKFAIVGCSAGGCLAAAALLRRRDRAAQLPGFQLLIYPVLDDRMNTVSMQTANATPVWDRTNTEIMWESYLGAQVPSPMAPPYAAPARAADVSRLPPTYIVTAEHDPLRDEGIEFARRLLLAGVATELHQFPGTFHGFDTLISSSISNRARGEQYAVLRAALHDS
jgi:acetyl esterase/lipase